MLIAAGAPARAGSSWKILLEGGEITGPCAPISAGRFPTVNILAVAPALGIHATVSGQAVTIVDSHAVEWHARNGSLSLDSAGKTMPLSSSVRVLGGAVYLPMDAVADLAGLQLDLDSKGQRAELSRPKPPKVKAAEFSDAGGWEGISVEKTAEEK